MITELKKVQTVLQNQKNLLLNLERHTVPDMLTLAIRIEDVELAEIDIHEIIKQLQQRNRGENNGTPNRTGRKRS